MSLSSNYAEGVGFVQFYLFILLFSNVLCLFFLFWKKHWRILISIAAIILETLNSYNFFSGLQIFGAPIEVNLEFYYITSKAYIRF